MAEPAPCREGLETLFLFFGLLLIKLMLALIPEGELSHSQQSFWYLQKVSLLLDVDTVPFPVSLPREADPEARPQQELI